MSSRLVVAPAVVRPLSEDLPEAVAWACHEFITGPLLDHPHKVGAPLRGKFEGLWRARRGEYRVRYRIDATTRTVQVVDISHRRDAYR